MCPHILVEDHERLWWGMSPSGITRESNKYTCEYSSMQAGITTDFSPINLFCTCENCNIKCEKSVQK
jgi:hypothetical protein